MTTSQDLYDQWQEHGGNLQQYDIPLDVENDRGSTVWYQSGLVRMDTLTWSNRRKRDTPRIVEKVRDLDECTDHIRFKHRYSETWLHIKSGTSIIVGEPVGFEAYVTINGQRITIGEYHVSKNPQEVIDWAVSWMEENTDVRHLYDD
jgi:hypothetical protein